MTDAPSRPDRAFTRYLLQLFCGSGPNGAGEPSTEHCEAVAAALGSDVPDDVWHAAMLHDIVNDTTVTLEHLRAAGYSDYTLAIITNLTMVSGTRYADHIRRIVQTGDSWLIRIRLADIEDDVGPVRGHIFASGGVPAHYAAARVYLQAALRMLSEQAIVPRSPALILTPASAD